MAIPDYEHYVVPTNVLASFAAVADFLAPGPVLDVGCADGAHLERLGPSSVGVDLSLENIRSCRARGLQVVQHDFSGGLPFRDGEFQAVLCSHVIEHMENPLALMRDIRRVTAVGGRVAIGVPQEHSLVRAIQGSHYYEGHPGHLYAFSGDGLRRLAEVAGFNVVRILYDPPLARRIGRPQWTEGFNRLPEWFRSAMTFNLWLLGSRETAE